MGNLPNEASKIIVAIIVLSPTIQLMYEVPRMLISVPENATLKARVEYVKKHYDGSKKYHY